MSRRRGAKARRRAAAVPPAGRKVPEAAPPPPPSPRFDWAGLMRAGIGGLGLRPDEFWRLTPVELLLLLGLEAGPAPLTRDGLMRLAERWGGAAGEGRGERGDG